MAKKTGKVKANPKTKKTSKPLNITPLSSGRSLKQHKRKLNLKKIKHPGRLPSVFKMTKTVARLIWQHKKLFIGLTISFGIINLILVQGLAGTTDVGSVKNSLDQLFRGNFGALASGISVFAIMVSSAGNSSSPTAGAYQVTLTIIGSLAVIWALRQVMASKVIRVRDAYYSGMYPLIPFVLVLVVIAIQLLPLTIGIGLYNLVMGGGIAVGAAEKIIWIIVCLALVLWSLYMISSSLFALYIVTLPDMTPIKALRSAKQLVKYRRWTVLRKVVYMPIALLVLAAIVMLPIILWLTFLASWVFFLLTMFALVAVHAYMYNLYRELLNE